MNLTDFNHTNKKEKFVIIIMIKSTQIDNKIKKIKKSETLTQTTRKQTCQIYIYIILKKKQLTECDRSSDLRELTDKNILNRPYETTSKLIKNRIELFNFDFAQVVRKYRKNLLVLLS